MKQWVRKVKSLDDTTIRILVIAAIAFALCVGVYEGEIIKHVAHRTPGQVAAYAIVNLWESAIFGFGVGFFIVYGKAILSLESGLLKNRCIGIWLSISYFFMSWFPHASVHQFLHVSDPTDFIILEICFHWPNLLAAFILCYYQFDVILMSYSIAKNNRDLRGWSDKDTKPVPWYKDIKFHSLVLSIIGIVGWTIFAWKLNPLPPFVNQWQKAILITIYITDGTASGIGLGFAYAGSRLAYRLPKKRTRVIAAMSVISIAYLLTVSTPHPVVHRKVATNPDQTILVEYLFHFSITAAVCVLGFFQHRFLALTISGRIPKLVMKMKSSKAGETITSETEKKSNSNSNSNSTSQVELSTIEVHTTPDGESPR